MNPSTAPRLVGRGGGASRRGRGSQSGVGSCGRQPLPTNKMPTLNRRPYVPPFPSRQKGTGKKQAGGEVSAAAGGALNISY